MKKLFCSLLACCSLTLFAQEKTYNFDYKISYNHLISNDIKETYGYFEENSLNIYLGKDGLLGHSLSDFLFDRFQSTAFLITPNRYYEVVLKSLENNIDLKTPSVYEYSNDKEFSPYNTEFYTTINNLVPLNHSETINGYTCNYYLLEEEDNNDKTTVCIDETSKINNVSYLIPQSKVKGLIIKLGSDLYDYAIVIDKVEASKLQFYFDENKAITNYQNKLATLKKQYDDLYETPTEETAIAEDYSYETDNRYEDPLYEYYNLATSDNNKVNTLFNSIASSVLSTITLDSDYDNNFDFDRVKALKATEKSTKNTIQSYKKNGLITKDEAKELNNYFTQYFNQAKNFKFEKSIEALQNEDVTIDTIDAADYAADVTLDYQSDYKNISIKDVQLGIDDDNAKFYLNIAPSHCKDLKNKIPDFSNSDLKDIVYNYAGQICDLYLYEFGFVDVRSTIDALRKSIWELSKNYDSYKNEDKEKLKKFFDSLD